MTDANPLRPRPWIDPLLAAVGVLFGWSSLTFPFGRDQGLYYYVAREWVTHGSIPYRDVLDHKTPGIYVVHAVAILLFGSHMWAIRILDMLCVVLVGLLAATFTVDRGERPLSGVRGGSVVLISVLFYGFLNFWDTAQSELWYSMLGLASIWAARRIAIRPRAEAFAGALGAAAMIMKPPAIWFVLIAFCLCIQDIWQVREGRLRRAAITTARFGAGFAAPLILMFAYFGAHHALGAMKDIVVGANSYYVTHESSINDLGDVVSAIAEYYSIYNPVDSAMLAGLATAILIHHRYGNSVARNRHILGAILCAAGFLAVAMQKKFYLLHWAVVLGPATVVGANLIADTLRLVRSERETRLRGALFIFAAFLFYSGTQGANTWLLENRNAFKWLFGNIDRQAYADTFCVPSLGFWYGHSEAVGLWIAAHSEPTDVVAVRGFDPEIYAVANRRYGGRFFWTTFLVSPVRAYRRAEWLAEDEAAFAVLKPRFVVALTEIHDGLDAPETYYHMGYVERLTVGEFTIVERSPSVADASKQPPAQTTAEPN